MQVMMESLIQPAGALALQKDMSPSTLLVLSLWRQISGFCCRASVTLAVPQHAYLLVAAQHQSATSTQQREQSQLKDLMTVIHWKRAVRFPVNLTVLSNRASAGPLMRFQGGPAPVMISFHQTSTLLTSPDSAQTLTQLMPLWQKKQTLKGAKETLSNKQTPLCPGSPPSAPRNTNLRWEVIFIKVNTFNTVLVLFLPLNQQYLFSFTFYFKSIIGSYFIN